MNKQEWVSKAKARLVERGFPDDERTQDYAQSIHDEAAVEVEGYEDRPVQIVDEGFEYF